MLASLKSQFRMLVLKLSIDAEIAEGVMSLFDWKSAPRDVVLKNAKQGLEGRQVLSTELLLPTRRSFGGILPLWIQPHLPKPTARISRTSPGT